MHHFLSYSDPPFLNGRNSLEPTRAEPSDMELERILPHALRRIAAHFTRASPRTPPTAQSSVTVESDGSINTTAPTAESNTTDHINDTVVQAIKDLPPKLRPCSSWHTSRTSLATKLRKSSRSPLKTLDKRMVRALRACRDELDRRGVSLAPKSDGRSLPT